MFVLLLYFIHCIYSLISEIHVNIFMAITPGLKETAIYTRKYKHRRPKKAFRMSQYKKEPYE